MTKNMNANIRAEDFHSEVIFTLIDWIHENIETKITTTRLSELSGYSRWYIQRLFRKIKGVTVGTYIREYRINIACASLHANEMTITTISWRVGFDSPQSFSRAFKNRVGMSPLEYRTLYA